MSEFVSPLPSLALQEAIQRLATTSTDASSYSAANVCDVFVSLLVLLTELKRDQATLHRASLKGGQNATFPPPTEIPAITAVIQSPLLLSFLTQSLQTTLSRINDAQDTSHPGGTSGPTPPNSQQQQQQQALIASGRKRSLSFAAENNANDRASKVLKHCTTSPVPTGRNKLHIPEMSILKPSFSLYIFATNILYSSFYPFDHWPDQLVKVYAEDCFGARQWVDDERCSLLVQNLSLIHASDSELDNKQSGNKKRSDADLIREYYHRMNDEFVDAYKNPSSPQRRGSLDSNSSRGESKCGQLSISSLDPREDSSLQLVTLPYPISLVELNLVKVRERYFGSNLVFAHEAITTSLSVRLEQKNRQSSGLLQSLTSFTSVPGVRCMVSEHLENWLKSPALAGLARTLFSSTVNHMKSRDPPLQSDLTAIENILSMKLKSNQFNAHIENISAIARRMPLASLANHTYSILLGRAHSAFLANEDWNRNEIRMICAIHKEINPLYSYDALAATMLTLLVKRNENTSVSQDPNPVEREQCVLKLMAIIQELSTELGTSFDGCQLIAAFLSLDVNTDSWSIRDEEDKARLMFQCALFSVDLSEKDVNRTNGTKSGNDLSNVLRKIKKLFLSWCCSDYLPRFNDKKTKTQPNLLDEEHKTSAGTPDFDSALVRPSNESSNVHWLSTVRSVLFLESADSYFVQQFLSMNGTVQDGNVREVSERIRICYEFGGDVDDDMLWIILKSAAAVDEGIDFSTAILLLENLFENCSVKNNGTLRADDPMIVWELYSLVRYNPIPRSDKLKSKDSTVDNEYSVEDLPILALPGLWWRVTMLALILCGCSPKNIGHVVWSDHPTLRAMMKMITSNRYRFPPIDCDESTKATMKAEEQTARDEEAKAADFLFLPKVVQSKSIDMKGTRVSQRLMKQLREKELEKEFADASKRKRMLRLAQKSIMLWDPDGPARKPPAESVELLLSVERTFNLSEVFQKTTDPDFLLLTIGQTTRDAIERAYGWLIPIISKLPDLIQRLPSSASCFLLLRAYGTEGDEQKELKQLSAPLLLHVKESLKGKYGESESILSFDLLMSDVASDNADRRVCARRVIADAMNETNKIDMIPHSWMCGILEVQFAKGLVADAVKYMSIASGFERGRVLCSLLMALEQHFLYAEKNSVPLEVDFQTRLLDLMSHRPKVYADALATYHELWCLTVRIVYAALLQCQEPGAILPSESVVRINIFHTSSNESKTVDMAYPLLQSICVCLGSCNKLEDIADEKVVAAVTNLTNSLMLSNNTDEFKETGLCSARFVDDENLAVSVESWIYLAKSKNDSIARRAALSAPPSFLCRLLLCSGLPVSSLLTMIDRLGRLGDLAVNKDQTYVDLLVPKASSVWDIGRVGTQQDLARKLLGRLSAYIRLNSVSANAVESSISQTFLIWLSEKCRSNQNEQLSKKKTEMEKKNISISKYLKNVSSPSSLLGNLQQEKLKIDPIPQLTTSSITMHEFIISTEQSIDTTEMDFKNIKEHLQVSLSNSHVIDGDRLMEKILSEKEQVNGNVDEYLVDILLLFLRHFRSSDVLKDGILNFLFMWIPRISRHLGSPEIWNLLFSTHNSKTTSLRFLANRCFSSWSKSQAVSCMDWILLDVTENANHYDCTLIASFLVLMSEAPSPQLETCQAIMDVKPTTVGWTISESFVVSATLVALTSLKQTHSEKASTEICRRNNIPPALSLILILIKCGKEQQQSVTDLIRKDMASAPTFRDSLHVVLLLRMYLVRPDWMDLGSAEIRTALVEAAERCSGVWTQWRSSLDEKMIDLINALFNSEFKVGRILSGLARRHPLLLLRRLGSVTTSLELDATWTTSPTHAKGVVTGDNITGPCEALVEGRSIRIYIKHWGYSFTEPIWSTFLDLISAVPREVLFTCGINVGLLDFLGLFVQLLSVQLQLMSAGKVTRLVTKLKECFTVFRQINLDGWNRWLGMKYGDSEIRHLLIICNLIGTQEALDTLEKR